MRLQRSLISCVRGAYRPFMPTPNEELYPWLSTLKRKEFLATADSRIGAVGALLELRDAALFRVDSYTVDDWGAKIGITHVPMPGFRSGPTEPIKISGCWDGFFTDPKRWQARYGWKFLFGDVEIQSVIAAGAEAAARGTLLTCSQVHLIFNWYQALRGKETEKPRLHGYAKPHGSPLQFADATSSSFGWDQFTMMAHEPRNDTKTSYELPSKSGGLNRSMQHWLEVYSPEFESPRSLAGVD